MDTLYSIYISSERDTDVMVTELCAAHLYDLVQALVSHHPDVRFAVVAAEKEHLHGDAKQLLELRRSPDPRDKVQTVSGHSTHTDPSSRLKL